MLKAC